MSDLRTSTLNLSLMCGISLDIQDFYDNTKLHYATVKMDMNAIHFLMINKVNTQICNNAGQIAVGSISAGYLPLTETTGREVAKILISPIPVGYSL